MPFLSFPFAFYLFAALLLFHFIPIKGRPAYLLALSYLYYASWNLPYTLLLAGSTALFYYSAIRIDGKADPAARTRLLILGNSLQLLVLAFFKLCGSFSSSPHAILLPLGLSYYSFKLMSYLIDVHRGKIRACREAA